MTPRNHSRRIALLASALLAASPWTSFLKAEDFYWGGTADNLWTTGGNWYADPTSNLVLGIPPSSTSDVFFSTTNPAPQNLDTTLGAKFSINSLTIKSASPPVSIYNFYNPFAITPEPQLTIGAGGLTVEPGTQLQLSTYLDGTGGITVGGTLIAGDAILTTINLTGPLTFTPGTSPHLHFTNGGASVGPISGDSTALIDVSDFSGGGYTESDISTNSAIASTFAGSIQNSTSHHVALFLTGGGTLTLDGVAHLDFASVDGGRLILNNPLSSITNAFTSTSLSSNTKTVLQINAGFVGSPITANLANGSNSQAALIINGGTAAITQELDVATGANSYAAVIINGGTLSTTGFLALSRARAGNNTTSGKTVFSMTGGQLSSPWVSVGSLQFNNANSAEHHTTADFSGGITNIENFILVGELVTGVMNVSNNAIINIKGTSPVWGVGGLGMGGNFEVQGVNGTLNLNGGTLTTPQITRTSNTSNSATQTINFNGGTVKASAPTQPGTDFMGGPHIQAFIRPGGLIIDDSGLAITNSLQLQAPTGNGLSSITGLSGTGYFAPPLVTITGGGGTGATASAQIDANGNLTAISITNPGINYTSLPTITLSGGGGTLTGAAASTLAPNSTGPLIKRGTGTLTLSAPATFGGPASIEAGRLSLAPNAGTSKISAITLAGTSSNWSSTLDLTNNALILQTSSPSDKANKLPTLQNQIAAGKTGPGITSSTVAADPTHLALALADNADLHYTSFRGISLTDDALILSQATFGDANLDGKVDAFDLNLLAAHWQTNVPGSGIIGSPLWSAGDFNGDGIVDAFDLNALAANWQFGASTLQAELASLPIPEPASLLLLLPAFLLPTRRRHTTLPQEKNTR